MTEVIIDHINTSFLIKRLRELFNPLIISEGNETVLNFNDGVGKGTFTIMTLDDDKLNIHFQGKFSSDTAIKFYNSKQSAINFFYLQKGHLLIRHNHEDNTIAENGVQQLIYTSDSNDVETIKWSADTLVEFNFLKLFDFSYVNFESEVLSTNMSFGNGNGTTYIRSGKSEYIDSDKPLIHSNNVAESRREDFENNIRQLFEIQKKEISK